MGGAKEDRGGGREGAKFTSPQSTVVPVCMIDISWILYRGETLH